MERTDVIFSLYFLVRKSLFIYVWLLNGCQCFLLPPRNLHVCFFFKGIQELGVKIRTFLAGLSGYCSQRSSVAFRWIEAVLLYRIFSSSPRRVFIRYSRAHHGSIVSADYANARWARHSYPALGVCILLTIQLPRRSDKWGLSSTSQPFHDCFHNNSAVSY